MVGIIDIGFGNIRSITNWLDRSTISYEVLSLPNNLSKFDFKVQPLIKLCLMILIQTRHNKIVYF